MREGMRNEERKGKGNSATTTRTKVQELSDSFDHDFINREFWR